VPKLRVGIVNFLNSKPLAWGFLKGHFSNLFVPSYHPPAQVARMLEQGNLEIGLIPSIEVQRIPGLTVLPDLCIASDHEVRSVLLVARTPMSEVRRVALDSNSRTSVALVRILLAERWGVEPELVTHRPDVDRMLADCEAALVIGDPALKVRRDQQYRIHDLAAEWKALTGLPFVFAVWAVRSEVDQPDLAFYFKTSLRYGLASLDHLVREAAAEQDLPPEEIRTYLTENLRYLLGDQERRGLDEFYRRAHAHGLLDEVHELDFAPGD
jgi:chorismate dehydratase